MAKNRMILGLLGLALSPIACGGGGSVEAPIEEGPMTIRLESTAFEEGGAIPRQHTCDGENASPPLSWSGVPEGARALVLIVADPDAPRGTFTHWVLYDLPAGVTSLPAGLPAEGTVRVGSDDARQGKNDFRNLGYGGPCPPSGTHRYFFRLYALDAATGLEPGASRQEVEGAMTGHVLARGELMGRYSRG